MSPEDDIVKRWVAEKNPAAAAKFLDAYLLIADPRRPETRIRLLLLSAVTHAESGSFAVAYRRVDQAAGLLESAGALRGRIKSSIDLVAYDIRRAEGKTPDETSP